MLLNKRLKKPIENYQWNIIQTIILLPMQMIFLLKLMSVRINKKNCKINFIKLFIFPNLTSFSFFIAYEVLSDTEKRKKYD